MKTLIVASGPLDRDVLKRQILRADRIIACDGGQDHLEAIGCKADLLIGDFDSIKSTVPGDIHYQAEKDFSDLQAALDIASKDSAHIRVVGATGGRLDHFLSAVMLLFGYEKDIEIIDAQNTVFVRTASFELNKGSYPYFSLIPLDEMIITIRGARYPLQQFTLKPYTSVGLSNEWKEHVSVEFKQGRLIVVLSSDNKKTP